MRSRPPFNQKSKIRIRKWIPIPLSSTSVEDEGSRERRHLNKCRKMQIPNLKSKMTIIGPIRPMPSQSLPTSFEHRARIYKTPTEFRPKAQVWPFIGLAGLPWEEQRFSESLAAPRRAS